MQVYMKEEENVWVFFGLVMSFDVDFIVRQYVRPCSGIGVIEEGEFWYCVSYWNTVRSTGRGLRRWCVEIKLQSRLLFIPHHSRYP